MDCNIGTCQECNIYEEEIRIICKEAINFIEHRPRDASSKPFLVIFDIDGTCLDDRKKSKNSDYIMSKHDPVYSFYQTTHALGYKILFLTGRLSDSGKIRENLTQEGYLPDHPIIFCPLDVERSPDQIGVWKDSVRGKLKQDYHLVACIGDQPMDVDGQHIGERQFRLPAPPIHQQSCVIQ